MLISIDKLNLRTNNIIIWLNKTKSINIKDLIHYYLHTFIRYKNYPFNAKRITIIRF
jgi:hypothetical protein